MNEKKKEFLRKLANLCEEYNASFSYSKDDDGITIMLNNRDIFTGFIYDYQDVPFILRCAAHTDE